MAGHFRAVEIWRRVLVFAAVAVFTLIHGHPLTSPVLLAFVLAALPLTRIALSSPGVGHAVLFAIMALLVASPSRLVAVAGAPAGHVPLP